MDGAKGILKVNIPNQWNDSQLDCHKDLQSQTLMYFEILLFYGDFVVDSSLLYLLPLAHFIFTICP